MKFSQMPNLTLREDPRDVTTVSHKLLLRAGMIRQVTAGVFSYMPLMQRSVRKVEQIVREEMDRAGACEIKMPVLQPRELWEESGRWNRYTKVDGIMFSVVGRRGNELCLAPTAEEVVTDIVRGTINSYKDLPVNLYQIGEKFRDEIRPRFGLMRGSEFLMKDAYSFDKDEAGMRESYGKMRVAYENVFRRCGVKFKVVQADSGAIGGSGSEEFMVVADAGEDTIIYCDGCEYAANVEKAMVESETVEGGEVGEMERVETPGVKTMEELESLTGIGMSEGVKSVIYVMGGEMVVVFIRGDLDVNEVKLGNILGGEEVLRAATDEEVEKVFGAKSGSIGPVGLPAGVRVVWDGTTEKLQNMLVGANETGWHIKNVNWERDVERPERYSDVRLVKAGDRCPKCGMGLKEARGIEVGHIFRLGTKYSEAMGATYKDADDKDQPLQMGCYGIGVTRLAQSAVEQSHDEKGIIWPEGIAPMRVHLVGLMLEKDTEAKKKAEEIYEKLVGAGVEVLYDDRDRSPGEKFADADLVGLPVRLTVSPRNVKEGVVEWKERRADGSELVSEEEVLGRLGV